MPAHKIPLDQRIAKFTRRNPETGCLLWTGCVHKKTGYGHIKVEGRNRCAHIVVYEEEVGPVPEGLELDHTCKNRACVEIDHLEPVTSKVNCHRSDSPAALNARKTHCDNGHLLMESNGRRRRCLECERIKSKRHYDKMKGVASDCHI
jgi:HNH endonuclease